MSGSFRNSRSPEGWPSGQEYWIYLPVNQSGLLPPIRSLNPRAGTRNPWLLVEERIIGGHDHGFASFLPPATPHPSVSLHLIKDSYPAPFDSPPANHLPWYMRSSNDEGKRCAVCLKDIETKHFVTISPCNHMFHEECIALWMKRQGKCPVCRFVTVE